MFKILQATKFYTNAYVRDKLREAHGIVERRLAERHLAHRIEGLQRRRRDILVTYLGRVSKSGVRHAQMYQDENKIFHEHVIEPTTIVRELQRRDVQAIVFADDFIGTGKSAAAGLAQLAAEVGEVLRTMNVVILYTAIAGFAKGKDHIERTAKKLNLPIEVYVGDPLGPADNVFGDMSTVFDEPNERQEARELAEHIGRRLLKDNPLGYGGLEAAVVFEMNCPNNTLPILWTRKGDWQPLFERI